MNFDVRQSQKMVVFWVQFCKENVYYTFYQWFEIQLHWALVYLDVFQTLKSIIYVEAVREVAYIHHLGNLNQLFAMKFLCLSTQNGRVQVYYFKKGKEKPNEEIIMHI